MAGKWPDAVGGGARPGTERDGRAGVAGPFGPGPAAAAVLGTPWIPERPEFDCCPRPVFVDSPPSRPPPSSLPRETASVSTTTAATQIGKLGEYFADFATPVHVHVQPAISAGQRGSSGKDHRARGRRPDSRKSNRHCRLQLPEAILPCNFTAQSRAFSGLQSGAAAPVPGGPWPGRWAAAHRLGAVRGDPWPVRRRPARGRGFGTARVGDITQVAAAWAWSRIRHGQRRRHRRGDCGPGRGRGFGEAGSVTSGPAWPAIGQLR